MVSGVSDVVADQEKLEALQSVFKIDLERVQIEVKCTRDRMKAFLDIIPRFTPVVRREEITTPIQAKFPAIEIDVAVVDEMCKLVGGGEPILNRRIAKGKPAVPGANGKLLLLVKPFVGAGAPLTNEKGVTTWKEVELFDNIEKDQPVARVYPPKPGTDGVDALGVPIIAKPGAAVKINIDKSLILKQGTEDGSGADTYDRLVAAVSGYLLHQGPALSVKEELALPNDVAPHCGHINFIGKAVVSGNVMPGFLVSGKLGVVVRGNLEQGNLISEGGDIEVLGFAVGSGGTEVQGKGEFRGVVLQSLTVDVLSHITIQKAARDCRLFSGGAIIMPGATLVGGWAHTVAGIEAKEIGNEAGQTTIVQLCSPVEVTREYRDLIKRIVEHEQAAVLLERHLGPYATNSSRLVYLRQPLRGKIEKIVTKLKTVSDSRGKLVAERDSLLHESNFQKDARINVKKMIHQGVQIIARECKIHIQESISGPISFVFDPEKNEIFQVKYEAITTEVKTKRK